VGESKIVRDVYATITKIAEPSAQKDPLLKEHFISMFPTVNMKEYTVSGESILLHVIDVCIRKKKHRNDKIRDG
jgi:hypothetical protein